MLTAVALVAGLAVLAGPSVAEEAGGSAQPTTTSTAPASQPAQQQAPQTDPNQSSTQQQAQPANDPAQAQQQQQVSQQQEQQQPRQPSQAEIDAYWQAVHAAEVAARNERLRDAIARRDWLRAFEQYDWNAALAHKVVYCESRFRPEARNGRHHGLFQIRNGSYDPAANIEQAYQMYKKRGWRPWYASRRCWRRR